MPKCNPRLVVGSLVIAFGGCNSHAYYREAMQYQSLARTVLVSRGVCSNEQDCQKKKLLFAEGGELSLGFVSWGGANITLYETTDAALVEEVSTQFRELHAQLKAPRVDRKSVV